MKHIILLTQQGLGKEIRAVTFREKWNFARKPKWIQVFPSKEEAEQFIKKYRNHDKYRVYLMTPYPDPGAIGYGSEESFKDARKRSRQENARKLPVHDSH